MKYYKVGKYAKSFSCSVSGMTVTTALPGKAGILTTLISSALKNGHLIEISKTEYEQLVSNYEQRSSGKFIKTSAEKPKAEENHTGKAVDTEREELMAKVGEYELSKKELKAFQTMTNEQIADWLAKQEE